MFSACRILGASAVFYMVWFITVAGCERACLFKLSLWSWDLFRLTERESNEALIVADVGSRNECTRSRRFPKLISVSPTRSPQF